MYNTSKISTIDNLNRAKQRFENDIFKVSVPYLATLSQAEMTLYGVYRSNVKEIDKDIHNQMTNVCIPVKEILRYFKEGATIRLCVANDIKDIYIIMQNYLEAWKIMLEYGVNLAEAPTSDLIELDKLATEVFSRAKYYFGHQEVESVLTSYITEITKIHHNNFFKPTIHKVISDKAKNISNREGVTTINAIDDVENQQRDDFSDFFKKKIYGSRFQR
jgi:hypothetical protein